MNQNYREAEEEFRLALRISPRNPLVIENISLSLYRQGDIDQAIFSLTRALWIAPRDARLRNTQAFFLIAAGRHDAARRQLRVALALNPNLVAAYLQRGRLNIIQNDLPAAERDFRSTIRLSQRESDASRDGYLALAEVLSRLGRVDEAERVMARATGEIHPSNNSSLLLTPPTTIRGVQAEHD